MSTSDGAREREQRAARAAEKRRLAEHIFRLWREGRLTVPVSPALHAALRGEAAAAAGRLPPAQREQLLRLTAAGRRILAQEDWERRHPEARHLPERPAGR
jgi:hypothetical protein